MSGASCAGDGEGYEDEAGVDARVGVVAGGVAAPLRHTMQTESVAPPPGAANTALFRLLTEP